MTGQSLTERRKRETRYDIAKAAMSLFARDGFDQVGADEIAAEAGVSVRTFYRYFPGKDETLSPIIAKGTAELASAIEARPAPEPLAVAVQAAYSEISSGAGLENVHTLIRLLIETPVLRAGWLGELRDIEESLASVVLKRTRGLSAEDARLTAATIVAALRLTLERSTRMGSSEPLADALGASLRYLSDGAHLQGGR